MFRTETLFLLPIDLIAHMVNMVMNSKIYKYHSNYGKYGGHKEWMKGHSLPI